LVTKFAEERLKNVNFEGLSGTYIGRKVVITRKRKVIVYSDDQSVIIMSKPSDNYNPLWREILQKLKS